MAGRVGQALSPAACPDRVNAALDDVTITLGNERVTRTVAENEGKHVGHIRIGRATVEWRKGKTRAKTGRRCRCKLVQLLEEHA
jgi:predicted N-acetyltransferase YhbS